MDKKVNSEKKIIVYGTGVVAQRVLERYSSQIVCILDRNKFDGELGGKPILTWEEISEGSADALIIAAARRNIEEIYIRISYLCSYIKLPIYDEFMNPLEGLFDIDSIKKEDAEYLLKSKKDLIREIDDHEAISFDLFDTLIMRKVLKPSDVFDIVELRCIAKYPEIKGFKKKRRIAERMSNGASIYEIYRILQEQTGWNSEVIEMLQQMELSVERESIVPRNEMVECMRYALKKGKNVAIISDMYLTRKWLEALLDNLNIQGYSKMYVSCEYGVGKAGGLFDIYKREASLDKLLHIGDHRYIDGEMAKKSGIDSFIIKSAYELFRVSSLKSLSCYEQKLSNRIHLGYVNSRLFNNPFTLFHTVGKCFVEDIGQFAQFFLGPIIVRYFQQLKKLLNKKEYKGIIFGTRDGFLFYNAYRKLCECNAEWKSIGEKVSFFYIYLSRKLAYKIAMNKNEDIDIYKTYLRDRNCDSIQDQVNDLFKENPPMDDYKQILLLAQKSIKAYDKYLKEIGIFKEEDYLYCECIAAGNQHDAFNRYFGHSLDGFYLYKTFFRGRMDHLSVVTAVKKEDWNDADRIILLMETILSSPDASIKDISEAGKPIYEKDNRSQKEIRLMLEAQSGIIQYISADWDMRIPVQADFACNMLSKWIDVNTGEDINTITEAMHWDNVTHQNRSAKKYFKGEI